MTKYYVTAKTIDGRAYAFGPIKYVALSPCKSDATQYDEQAAQIIVDMLNAQRENAPTGEAFDNAAHCVEMSKVGG